MSKGKKTRNQFEHNNRQQEIERTTELARLTNKDTLSSSIFTLPSFLAATALVAQFALRRSRRIDGEIIQLLVLGQMLLQKYVHFEAS